MKECLLILSFACLACVSARAANFTAEVTDENKSKQLYTLTVTETAAGSSKRSEAVYKTPDGKVAFTEKTDVENGEFKSYVIDQPDARISGKIEAQANKLKFSFTENGETKTDDDDFNDNTIVPSTASDFIQKHWDSLLKGEDANSRFAVADRRETVGFKFFKVGDEKRDGKDVVVIRMKPTSFIIAAILPKPVLFIIDKATRKNIEFHGRLPFKRLENGKLRDQDGVIVYHYQ